MEGRFLVIEGLDGSGGTTQCQRLTAWLRDVVGREVVLTREPTDLPVGRFIRQALAPDTEASVLSDAVLPYLFAADRRDHLDRRVLPALRRGAVVISDRYLHSSLAYQSLSIGFERVAALNKDFPVPDLTVFLQLSPELCVERIGARNETKERFERLSMLREIHKSYDRVLEHCERRGDAVARLDASLPISVVFEHLLDRVRPLVGAV